MSDPAEDCIYTTENLDEHLANCLENIESAGSFALFEGLKLVPNPGIVIGDHGIGLPLSNNDALTIVSASHPAPFGRGTETVVDLKIRKTYELSANEFRLANPDWDGFVKQILKKIGEGMGLTAAGKKITAQIYKLLLYEEGAMFKPHQDSEKAPGMFGTLVIALPSKHEGGEVFLTHGGRKKTFETSKYSDFDYSYLAWFSDVIHEVKPVISGRRLVLTYNLIQTNPGQIPSASSSSKEITKLRSIFSWWIENPVDDPDEIPQTKAYMLEHHYTEASLSFNSLKGKDLQIATYLKEAAAETYVYFCLANVERTVVGGCDDYDSRYRGYRGYYDEEESDEEFHTIEDVIEQDISLLYVAGLDGSEIGRDMPFGEDHLIQKDIFDDLSPDDEDFEGHTGNEGATATHFYRRTVAILMPRSHCIPFFLQSTDRHCSDGGTEIIKWLDSLSEDLTKKPESAARISADIKSLCALVIEQTRKSKKHDSTPQQYSDKVLARVLQAAFDLNDKTSLAEACTVFYDKLSDPLFRCFDSGIAKLDLLEFLPKIAHSISKIPSFSDRCQAIVRFCEKAYLSPDCSVSQKEPFCQWCTQQLIKVLRDVDMNLSSASDGRTLCMFLDGSMDMSIPEVDLDSVGDAVKSTVRRKIQSTEMVFAFLNKLIDREKSGGVSKELSQPIFAEIITELIQNFDLRTIKRAKHSQEPDHLGRPSTARAHAEEPGFARLMCYCHTAGLKSELGQIIGKLCEEAQNLDVQNLDKIFPAFLKDLVDELRAQSVIIVDSPFRGLFQTILNTYILRCVPPEPKAEDWSREEVVCLTRNCDVCAQLNVFLRNPTSRELKLTLSVKREQSHISSLAYTELRGRNCVLESNLRAHIFTVKKQQVAGKHDRWEKRYNHVKKRVEALDSNELKELLEECYDFIVSLSAVRRAVPSTMGSSQPTLGPTRVSRSASFRPSTSTSSMASSTPNNGHSRARPSSPSWFVSSLLTLRKKYPDDLFDGKMKYGAKNTNNQKVSWEPQHTPLPSHIVSSYFPSINCLDCPELEPSQSGPSNTLNNFEDHLKDKTHRARVNARIARLVSRREVPAAQIQANQNGSSAADRVAPLPQNRKRTVEMIDMTGDSD